MKKYLLIGLAILLGTNLMALGGVVYNRMGEPKSVLTLTERELKIPYIGNASQENSGMMLTINWRAPSAPEQSYYSYYSKEIESTKEELIALGFDNLDGDYNYFVEPTELYWALEFDGLLHKVEVEKAVLEYQAAETRYAEEPNDNNDRIKNDSEAALEREKTTNSRLFFMEAAIDYTSLANKYDSHENIIIVKGLTKPFYNNKDQEYRLILNRLLVSNIMVPLAHADVFTDLQPSNKSSLAAPRYSVNIKWGNRLEPWIANTTKIN